MAEQPRSVGGLGVDFVVTSWPWSSAVLMILLILVAFPLASVVAPIHPHRIEIREIGLAPGEEGHLLGTDLTGRDVWSRVVYGGRVSMSVGIVAVALFVTIGTILGSVAGYYGGRVDSLIMRITDTFMAFPTLIILITIVSFIGPGIFNSMLAIGLIGWTGVCRLVRSLILSIRETDYVMAAQAVGVEQRWIIIRHILPNVVAPITVAASFGIAGAILTEAGLSFLGLGVQVPTPSWGQHAQRSPKYPDYREHALVLGPARPDDYHLRAGHQLHRRRPSGCSRPAHEPRLIRRSPLLLLARGPSLNTIHWPL